MTNRRIIIGDVHGHYDTLNVLLEAISPNTEDSIYFLGDLIDRGPKSAQVVNFVIKNNYACILGNHEQMLLDVVGDGTEIAAEMLQAWLYSGGTATLASYDNKIPQEHINWLKSLPIYLDLGDLWLVHAGVNPKLSIPEHTAQQCCWIRDEFHSMTKPYFEDKLIITGHTITFTLPGVQPGKLAAGEGWLDIDTGAYHQNSGWLTALDANNGIVYQVHTQKSAIRTIALEKAITKIDPRKIIPRKSRRFL